MIDPTVPGKEPAFFYMLEINPEKTTIYLYINFSTVIFPVLFDFISCLL